MGTWVRISSRSSGFLRTRLAAEGGTGVVGAFLELLEEEDLLIVVHEVVEERRRRAAFIRHMVGYMYESEVSL